MNTHRAMRLIPAGMLVVTALTNFPAHAGTVCFTASRSYQVHPLRGGGDARDGWSVKADAFSRCVHRTEIADKLLRAKYPETIYTLSLAATIGCHEGC